VKPLLTKSNDGCFIIVRAEEKTDKNDLFISEATLKKNIKSQTFIKHKTLKYNNHPIYIYNENL
tara:strand:- start:603 stop:794 length:192 start_codon:yes stop_codon:yes gene_type:complete